MDKVRHLKVFKMTTSLDSLGGDVVTTEAAIDNGLFRDLYLNPETTLLHGLALIGVRGATFRS